MTKGRREHARVLADILAAVDRVNRDPDRRESLTRVAFHANVAFDRLQAYLDQLRGLGLLVADRTLKITPLGQGFLLCYRQWNGVLADYGIENAPDHSSPRLLKGPRLTS